MSSGRAARYIRQFSFGSFLVTSTVGKHHLTRILSQYLDRKVAIPIATTVKAKDTSLRFVLIRRPSSGGLVVVGTSIFIVSTTAFCRINFVKCKNLSD